MAPLSTQINRSTFQHAGATVLVLAIYGLYRTPTEVYRRLVPFAALAAALLLAISFGVPGVAELGRLPGLNVTRIPYYFAPVTGFCLALLPASVSTNSRSAVVPLSLHLPLPSSAC